MNINATIFIQAFNFFIVYWMLRIFLFKPVIDIIEQEKADEYSMLDTINQQQKSIEFQEKERQRHWYICQEYFNTHQPHLYPQTVSCTNDPEHNKNEINEQLPSDITQTISDIHRIIEEKIKHVH